MTAAVIFALVMGLTQLGIILYLTTLLARRDDTHTLMHTQSQQADRILTLVEQLVTGQPPAARDEPLGPVPDLSDYDGWDLGDPMDHISPSVLAAMPPAPDEPPIPLLDGDPWSGASPFTRVSPDDWQAEMAVRYGDDGVLDALGFGDGDVEGMGGVGAVPIEVYQEADE